MLYQITMIQHLSVLLTSLPTSHHLTCPFNHCAFLWVLEQAQLVPASDFTSVVPLLTILPQPLPTSSFHSGPSSSVTFSERPFLTTLSLTCSLSHHVLTFPIPLSGVIFLYSTSHLAYCLFSLLHFNVTSIGQGVTVYPPSWKQCLVYNST